ncbi:hypothetical protein [Actinoallomurus sp. CA-142502]|uniref:hypothetical protein n=1 Tax=Actinoallomurus sp. CA-142502 TaxID=3239885 RepID=UPI003D92F1F0
MTCSDAGRWRSSSGSVRWARDGRLTPIRTPGGHRRYRLAAIRRLLEAERGESGDALRQRAEDAVRLYEPG